MQGSEIPLKQPALKLQGCTWETDGTTTVIFSLLYLGLKIWKFYLQPPQLCRGFSFNSSNWGSGSVKSHSAPASCGSADAVAVTIIYLQLHMFEKKTEGRKRIWAKFHPGWCFLNLLEEMFYSKSEWTISCSFLFLFLRETGLSLWLESNKNNESPECLWENRFCCSATSLTNHWNQSPLTPVWPEQENTGSRTDIILWKNTQTEI